MEFTMEEANWKTTGETGSYLPFEYITQYV